jgi:putative membrane protein
VQEGGTVPWPFFLLGAVGVALVGLIFSVTGAVVMFYGFTLSRKGEDLHRTYGLLTRRSSSLPRRRIQVLKVEESLLRRLLRLATLRADTAGSPAGHGREGAGGRDVLLPVVPRAEVPALLPSFFPDLETGPVEWQRVSRRAIRRGTLKGAVAFLAVGCFSFGLQNDWRALWPWLFIPLVYLANLMSFRHLGYWLGEKYFRTRRGWLRRATHIVPIRNAQAILLRQTPFDRRLGVVTLTVDTAGQAYTGGGPKVHNVPVDEALALARTLAQRAAATRYRW